MAQVDWLRSKVGIHRARFCIHRMNWVTLAMTLRHDDTTINIVLVLLLLLLLLLLLCTIDQELVEVAAPTRRWANTTCTLITWQHFSA